MSPSALIPENLCVHSMEHFMKQIRSSGRPLKSLLAAVLLTAAGIGIAEAQYYSDRSVCVTSRGNCDAGYAPLGAGCYCNIPGFGRKAGNVGGAQYAQPRPRYRERPVYEDDGFAPRPRPRYDDGYSPRPRAYGTVCVTSRGECPTGRPVPIMSGCYCKIPGFGRKAGNVRY